LVQVDYQVYKHDHTPHVVVKTETIREPDETFGFTEPEMRYIMERKLGRIALVADEQPHIVPVTYEFDGAYFYISGWNVNYGPSFAHVREKNKVTMLIDDLTSAALWVPRGIEVMGDAETFEKGDYNYLRITPRGKNSWGL
jgi:pyridoxamine 5'-phosphate oxidase family protein